MKTSELMLGNTVALCYDHKPSSIIALEDGVVHLDGNKLSDDERDIEGVSLTNWIIQKSGSATKGRLMTVIKGMKLYFTIIKSNKKAILIFQLNEPQADIFLVYHHQLQNFIFILTGFKLMENQLWIFEK